jgi:hypothetical protein
MKSQIEQFTMAAPLLITFTAFIIPLFTGLKMDFNFFILLSVADVLNYIIKHYIVQPIMKDKTYPIIGHGKRPDGATSTGIFFTNKPTTTYGMPSGHAQGVSVFSTYLITNKIMKSTFSKYIKLFLSLILATFAILVMYGRVILTKAHTIQQVIVGSLVGITIVIIYNKFIAKQ